MIINSAKLLRFYEFLDFKVNFDTLAIEIYLSLLFENCHFDSRILFISSNYWQVVESLKRIFDPIIGIFDPIIGS